MIETKWDNECPPRLIHFKNKRNSKYDLKELEEEFQELRCEIKEIKLSSNPRSFKFQDLSINNLRDIHS